MIIKKNSQSGYAIVTLLVFMAISIAIVTASVIVIFNTSQASSRYEAGLQAYYAAESGAENALIRLLRDPTYSGESLTIDDSTVVVQVNNGTIVSKATVENSTRKIQVETLYNNTILTISSWKEIN